MPKLCRNCNKKLSIWSYFTGTTLCNDCDNNLKEELERVGKEISSNKTITDKQIETLKKQDKQSLLKLYGRIYDDFSLDKELAEDEISTLDKIQNAYDLTKEEVDYDNRIRPYEYVNSIKKEGKLPVPSLKIESDKGSNIGVILKKDEVVHFADSAILKEIKTISLGYQGGSQGVSIRIAKGISYRVGSSRGQLMKEDRLIPTSQGALLVTNQRILLQPYPGYKPVSIPLNKILSHSCYNNGIEIYKEGREKGFFFQLSKTGSIEIFELCLNFLLKQ